MTYGAFPSGRWENTGGALVFSSVVTGLDGITGIAGGGTVFNFQDGIGWKQLGNLTGAVTIAHAISPTSGPYEFYAQTANGELYYLKAGATQWVDTKVLLFPSTIKTEGGGVTGIGAQGSVWHYEDTGKFTRVGTMTGVVALTPFDSHLRGELFAQVADGSIWLATYAAGYPEDPAHANWTPTMPVTSCPARWRRAVSGDHWDLRGRDGLAIPGSGRVDRAHGARRGHPSPLRRQLRPQRRATSARRTPSPEFELRDLRPARRRLDLVLQRGEASVGQYPRLSHRLGRSSPGRPRTNEEPDAGRGSGIHLAGLDLAGGELVEFEVLEVPVELARTVDLARGADGVEPTGLEDDHLIA